MMTQLLQHQLEQQLRQSQPSPTIPPLYIFELYTGRNPASANLVQALQQLFAQQSQTDYRLDVIDVWDNPERVEAEKIVATPTLIQRYPLPCKRLVGAISDSQALRSILGLPANCESRAQE